MTQTIDVLRLFVIIFFPSLGGVFESRSDFI